MVFSKQAHAQRLSATLRVCAIIVSLTGPVYMAQAQGTNLNVSFSNAVQTSATDAPGVWYTDRFAPCGFTSPATPPQGNAAALQESICQGDYHAAAADHFFNTQGRKLDLGPYAVSTSINLYIPDTWQNAPQREAGVWDTATNSSGVVGNDYGILEFQGPIPAGSPVQGPGFYPNSTAAHPNGIAGFYGWDNVSSNFVFIGLPDGFKYNSWVTLTISMSPSPQSGTYTYTVSTNAKNSTVSAATSFYDSTEVATANTILEGYNYGVNYSIFWEKFSYYSIAVSCKTQK